MSNQDHTGREPKHKRYARAAFIVFFLNLLAFGAISVIIGGDAINGSIDAGTYYVSARGEETAVHPLVWYFSMVHGCIVIGSFVLFAGYAIASRSHEN